MATPIVFIVVVFYIALLFGIARWGDRQHFVEGSWVRHPLIYALALGVYCTSWTFYGLVGTAAEKGWNFLPILLGPILLFTIGYPVLERIRLICRQEHIHSIADFVTSRYGKRQGVAATVTVVVLLATIPYIALQIKAVSDTLSLTMGSDFFVNQDITFIITLSMIAFTLLFGVRRLDLSGYHSGLMSAVAFESIVKIIVLLLVALFAISWLNQDLSHIPSALANKQLLSQPDSWLRFFIETLLSVCAIFCLPRMFHITFVECLSAEHLKKSRWVFVSYLSLISLCVLAIAWVGNILFFDSPVNGDTYVIALPLMKDLPWLATAAFIGGFSAATAMIIVATMTLSQMLSNDVILPLLMHHRKNKRLSNDFTRSLIISRRLTVLFVIIGAYLYQIILAENVALTSIGLIAFALVVQLAPAILFGLYWRRGNARGLYAGLVVGLILWFYTLMIPLLGQAGLISTQIIEQGLFGLGWLRPEYLFSLHFSDSFTRGVIISLSANIIFYCWYSLTSLERLSDRIQATAFTHLQKTENDPYEDIELDDLRTLLNQFLGQAYTRSLFAQFYPHNKQNKQELIDNAMKTLAGTIGIASSQMMIENLRMGKAMAMEEVVNLFSETTKALRFNQEIISASFENISSGISVVDKNLNLIAWNSQYESMFDYPESMLKMGLHVSDIMRFNGERGLLGKGSIDEQIRKRLMLMSKGNSYRVIRHHNNNTIIEIKGRPLPNGGYVTTYDDITEFISAQQELEDANTNLEERVLERTETIEKINQDLREEITRRGQIENELREAKIAADKANASKTKFLALAGHDIMQPLNAANLYASALVESDSEQIKLIEQLKMAIDNTESIIASLLEISKLDSGKLSPKREVFSLDSFLSSLISEFMLQKPTRLEIRYRPTSLAVLSDKHYLRRIVQNFISNAIKYTQEGKILIGCRRHSNKNGDSVEICVFDNGPGISEKEQTLIFEEFYRSNRQQQQKDNIPGIGLGLSVVMRFSELLEHPINCRSQLHKGSCFSVEVPIADTEEIPLKTPRIYQQNDELKGLNIVYVDDDLQNLQATSALLLNWQCDVTAINDIDQAQQYAQANAAPDVLLMDYQLGHTHINGLQLAEQLISCWQDRILIQHIVSVCIVSATRDIDLPQSVADRGFEFLRKPVKPAKLRALLTQFSRRQQVRC